MSPAQGATEHTKGQPMPPGFHMRVEGIRRISNVLDRLDEEAHKAFEKHLYRAGDFLRNEGRKNIPAGTSPLSNWKGKRGQDRTAGGFPVWKSASEARRGMKTDLFRPRGGRGKKLAAVVTSRSAAAVVFDWAGQGGSSSTFVDNITRKFGAPRRALLKAEDDKGEEAARKAGKAVQKALYDFTKRQGLN